MGAVKRSKGTMNLVITMIMTMIFLCQNYDDMMGIGNTNYNWEIPNA